jgi:hypothetical protein
VNSLTTLSHAKVELAKIERRLFSDVLSSEVRRW